MGILGLKIALLALKLMQCNGQFYKRELIRDIINSKPHCSADILEWSNLTGDDVWGYCAIGAFPAYSELSLDCFKQTFNQIGIIATLILVRDHVIFKVS